MKLAPISKGVEIDKHVCLVSLGTRNISWPAVIKINIIQDDQNLCVHLKTELVKIDRFIDQLSEINKGINSTAALVSGHEEFFLELTPDTENNLLVVKVEVSSELGSQVQLDCDIEYSIDQSYLPQIIRELKQEFNLGDKT